jgi:uncharacterized membrane protein YqjE
VSEDHKVHFDEFKVYLESAERTTDRRLDLNKTNAPLALLILAGIGAMVSWSYDKDQIAPIADLAVFLVSLLAAIFCFWWWKQIISYKELNSAKFQILNEMAKKLVITDGEGKVPSHRPFEKEWSLMEKNETLGKFGKMRALTASPSELTVPKSFLVAFLLISVAAVVVAVKQDYYMVLLFWRPS